MVGDIISTDDFSNDFQIVFGGTWTTPDNGTTYDGVFSLARGEAVVGLFERFAVHHYTVDRTGNSVTIHYTGSPSTLAELISTKYGYGDNIKAALATTPDDPVAPNESAKTKALFEEQFGGEWVTDQYGNTATGYFTQDKGDALVAKLQEAGFDIKTSPGRNDGEVALNLNVKETVTMMAIALMAKAFKPMSLTIYDAILAMGLAAMRAKEEPNPQPPAGDLTHKGKVGEKPKGHSKGKGNDSTQ
jgi:hypothetical protein